MENAKFTSDGIKVVLISLYHYGAFGTRILRDVLRTHNHKVFNIFFKKDKTNYMGLPTEHEKKLLTDLINDINPDLIGISTRSAFFPVAKDLTVRLKQNSGTQVIWGGAHPTICPEQCIEFADIICIGEGEKPIVELTDKLKNSENITNIKGLWIKKNNAIIKNELPNLLEDLDTLPLPSFDGQNIYAIENNKLYGGDPYYNVDLTHYNFMTARGCPFHCGFCSNSVLKKIFKDKGPFIRQRSVANVITELKLVRRRFKNLEIISSNDEIFCLNKEWLKEFCMRYKEEIKLPFHCDIYPTLTNENIIGMLKDAGLRTITTGIQSGSERIRTQLYGRKTSATELKNTAEFFSKYKVFPSYDLIFDNPMETEQDIRDTLHFMLDLPRPFRINMYSMQHHPKTELTERFLKEKLIAISDIDGMSLKGFNQWHVNFNYKTEKNELIFLYKLFLLLSCFINLSKKNPNKVMVVFPLWLIRFIENNRFLKNHQHLTDWISFLPKLTFGLSMLLQGKFKKLLNSTSNFLMTNNEQIEC